MKILILSLAILLLNTVIGCGPPIPYRAYVGDSLPRDQVASVYAGVAKEVRSGVYEFMDIQWVDDRPIKCIDKYFVHVLPGNHVLKVARYQSQVCASFTCPKNYIQLGTVNFNAESGKFYQLKSKWKFGTVHFWLENSKTGEVVSNEKPPITFPRTPNP